MRAADESPRYGALVWNMCANSSDKGGAVHLSVVKWLPVWQGQEKAGETAVDVLTWTWAKKYKWRATPDGYIYRTTRTGGRTGTNRRVYLHREIMGLDFGDAREIDHLNRDSWDNRRSNLEVVSRAENLRRRDSGISLGPKCPEMRNAV